MCKRNPDGGPARRHSGRRPPPRLHSPHEIRHRHPRRLRRRTAGVARRQDAACRPPTSRTWTASPSTGVVGRSNNVPQPLTPASDVATLSLFGYDPLVVYTGRAPLETAAMGIPLGPQRLGRSAATSSHVENGEMRDFTAGHITSEEGRPLDRGRPGRARRPRRRRPARVHRRRQLSQHPRLPRRQAGPVRRRDEDAAAARHSRQAHRRPSAEGTGQRSAARPDGAQPGRARRPSGQPGARARRASGRPRKSGCGARARRRRCEPFAEVYGKRGAILSAVDLVRGVGVLLGWKRIDVPGATGYLDTDYAAKGRYGVAALADHDLVCVHVEAPDEASHEGKADEKVKALERDRPAHRRPAAGGAAEARRLAHPGVAGPPHAAADAGPRLRHGAVRHRRDRASRRRGSRPTTRSSRRKAIWRSRRGTS